MDKDAGAMIRDGIKARCLKTWKPYSIPLFLVKCFQMDLLEEGTPQHLQLSLVNR